MKYRHLGKTGLLVSEIGLGTAQLGGPSVISGRYLGSPKIEKGEAKKILNLAFDSGINFYDTSDKYGDGEAERLLGEVFLKNRKKVIIATKCGFTSSGTRCFEKEYVKTCLEQSLKNLNTDYIDIFQLVKPDIGLIKSGYIYKAFDDLKREGKIIFSGISTGADEETLRLISDNKVDTLQIFYNLLHVLPNELFIADAHKANIGLIIRSPLSSGLLSGRYSYTTKFSSEDDRSLYLHGKNLISRVDMVNKIIAHFDLNDTYNILQMSLNYLLSNDRISTIIPGVSKANQLIGLLKVCFIERMSPDLFMEIENFVRNKLKE